MNGTASSSPWFGGAVLVSAFHDNRHSLHHLLNVFWDSHKLLSDISGSCLYTHAVPTAIPRLERRHSFNQKRQKKRWFSLPAVGIQKSHVHWWLLQCRLMHGRTRQQKITIHCLVRYHQIGIIGSLVHHCINQTWWCKQQSVQTDSWLLLEVSVASEAVEVLSLIHIWRCRRLLRCRSRWSP